VSSAKLRTNIASIELRNPLILASGILGTTGSILRRVGEAGAGAVTTKSVGIKPRKGNPNPTVIQLDYGFVNAIGLSNPGIDRFMEEIKIAKEGGIPVIVSIFGANENEFMRIAEKVEEARADAIELNLSCPHGPSLHFAQNSKLTYSVVSAVKSVVKLPVFAKLSPEVTDITEIGLSAEKAGADAITAINTLKAVVIDIKFVRPILSNIYGGLSGKAIKPVAVRCVYQLYENLTIPIIGVGGITDYKDAIEFLMAGATAVQIGSAIAIKGLEIFKEINAGLKEFLEKEGYNDIQGIRGIAHRR